MIEFISTNWAAVLLSLITAGALAFCKWAYKQMNTYKKLLEEKDMQLFDDTIDKKLEPIIEDIEELRDYVRQVDKSEDYKINLIISSYRFRLVQLCKIYLKQGYMTQDQYDQLTEFYKVYEGLGGNGQAKQYYEKTIILEIKEGE